MKLIDRLNITDGEKYYKCEMQDTCGCSVCKFYDKENSRRLCAMISVHGMSLETHCTSVMNCERVEANFEYVNWKLMNTPFKKIEKKKPIKQSQLELDIIAQLL